MKFMFKLSSIVGALLLAGTTVSLAGTDPKNLGEAFEISLYTFLFFWIASSVILMGIYGKKWLARYNDLQLDPVEATRPGTLESGEPDPTVALEATWEPIVRHFDDVDREHYVFTNSYKEALQLRSEILELTGTSRQWTEAQATRLNELIQIANWSLVRINGRVHLSKSAKVIVCIYWGLLILSLGWSLVAAFSFTSQQWNWGVFFSGIIGVPIAGYGLWQFFMATRVVYHVPGCCYEEFRASKAVAWYDKLWNWLAVATGSGVAASLATASQTTERVWVDDRGNVVARENDGAERLAVGLGFATVVLLIGFTCGGFLFFVVQPILMMWLFKKYFIACEIDPGATVPIWQRPKFPMWASLVCGGVMGVIVLILGIIALCLAPSRDEELPDSGTPKTEQVEPAGKTDGASSVTPVPEKDSKNTTKSAAGTSASSAKKTNVASAPEKPELTPIEKALREIPSDKNQLIEAYNRGGLTYLDGNTREMLAICRALDSRRTDLALAILKSYPNLAKEVYQERRSGEKRTLLIWASQKRSGYGDFAKALVAAGADVNAVSSRGDSALSNAVQYGNVELAQLLIESGADIGFKTSVGRSLTELARDNQAMQNLLFDAKKTFSEEDLKSVLAARNPDAAQVKKILASGVKPTDELMYAVVRKNNAKLLKLFLEAGGNANAKHNGRPIIFSCNYRGDISCAKLLVDAGANTNFTVAISGRPSYLNYLKNRRATELLNYIQKAKKSAKR